MTLLNKFLSFEAFNDSNYYISHDDFEGYIRQAIELLGKENATFKIIPGLDQESGRANAISFQSYNYPDHYLTHDNFRLYLRKSDGSDLFNANSTFLIEPGNSDPSTQEPRIDKMISFRSLNYPSRYIRRLEDRHLEITEADNNNFYQDSTFWVRKSLI